MHPLPLLSLVEFVARTPCIASKIRKGRNGRTLLMLELYFLTGGLDGRRTKGLCFSHGMFDRLIKIH